jgi:hypothetical protein
MMEKCQVTNGVNGPNFSFGFNIVIGGPIYGCNGHKKRSKLFLTSVSVGVSVG